MGRFSERLEYLQFFLQTLLKALGCREFHFEPLQKDSCKVGFVASKESVQLISAVIPEAIWYNDKSEYHICSITWENVYKCLLTFFREAVHGFVSKCNYFPGNFVGCRYVISDSLYDYLLSPKSIKLREYLLARGLAPKAEKYGDVYNPAISDVFFNRKESMWYVLSINDMSIFVKMCLLPFMKDQVTEYHWQIYKLLKLASKDELFGKMFDRSLIVNIFNHVKNDRTDAIFLLDRLNKVADNRVKKEVDSFDKEIINQIYRQIKKLQSNDVMELLSDKNAKENKILFLQLVLRIKDCQPHFSIKKCLEIAIEEDGALYLKAIKKEKSNTRHLLDMISKLEEKSSDVKLAQEESVGQKEVSELQQSSQLMEKFLTEPQVENDNCIEKEKSQPPVAIVSVLAKYRNEIKIEKNVVDHPLRDSEDDDSIDFYVHNK